MLHSTANEGNGRGQIQQAWIVSVAVCVTVIIVIAVIVTVLVVTLVAIRKSHNRENDSTVKVNIIVTLNNSHVSLWMSTG